MHPVLAWLPFAAALLLAFFAGVAFARINEELTATEAPSRRGGPSGLSARRREARMTAGLVGGVLVLLLVWLVVAFATFRPR